MSGTTVTILIVAIICICFGSVFIAQIRENARIEKIRKINGLTERRRHMQELLYELPPQYLSNDLRIMIAEQSIAALEMLIKLKQDDSLHQCIEQDRTFLKQIREQNPKFKAVPIKDEVVAKEVRRLLEILFRFVDGLRKRKILDPSIANKYLNHIRFSVCQCRADLFVRRAEEAQRIGKPRVAIHNYHNAIDALKELPNHPLANEATARYKERAKALEQVAEEYKVNAKIAAQKQVDASKVWDNYLDDESWKKKKFDD